MCHQGSIKRLDVCCNGVVSVSSGAGCEDFSIRHNDGTVMTPSHRRAIFHYKCTGVYNKQSERTLLYNDPVLGIDWKTENPVISEKDAQGVPLSILDNPFL